jgi:hypothetical protein
MDFQSGTNNTNDPSTTRLSISGTTGAATFSSSVTAAGGNSPTLGFQLTTTTSTSTPRITSDSVNATVIRTGASGSPVVINNFANSAELVRFTDAGNVGIGTSTFNYAGAGIGYLAINGSSSNFLEFQYGTTNTSGWITGNSSTLNLYTSGPKDLLFGTVGTERMRITSGGNVGIGSTGSTAVRLQVYGATSDSTTQAIGVNKANGTDLFYARNDGYLYSVGAWSGSDIRLKENITDLDNGLEKVLGLKARKFDLIDGLKNNYGFIAQELQEIIPDAVSVFQEEEQLLAIRMDYIIPHLVKAIQEQQLQIEELKLKIK